MVGKQRMAKYTRMYFGFILMRQDEDIYRRKDPMKM